MSVRYDERAVGIVIGDPSPPAPPGQKFDEWAVSIEVLQEETPPGQVFDRRSFSISVDVDGPDPPGQVFDLREVLIDVSGEAPPMVFDERYVEVHVQPVTPPGVRFDERIVEVLVSDEAPSGEVAGWDLIAMFLIGVGGIYALKNPDKVEQLGKKILGLSRDFLGTIGKVDPDPFLYALLAYVSYESFPDVSGIYTDDVVRAAYGPIALKLATTPSTGTFKIGFTGIEVPVNSQLIGLAMLGYLGFVNVHHLTSLLNKAALPWDDEYRDIKVLDDEGNEITCRVPEPLQTSWLEGDPERGEVAYFRFKCPVGDWSAESYDVIKLMDDYIVHYENMIISESQSHLDLLECNE